jgi:hypothetical protein
MGARTVSGRGLGRRSLRERLRLDIDYLKYGSWIYDLTAWGYGLIRGTSF